MGNKKNNIGLYHLTYFDSTLGESSSPFLLARNKLKDDNAGNPIKIIKQNGKARR